MSHSNVYDSSINTNLPSVFSLPPIIYFDPSFRLCPVHVSEDIPNPLRKSGMEVSLPVCDFLQFVLTPPHYYYHRTTPVLTRVQDTICSSTRPKLLSYLILPFVPVCSGHISRRILYYLGLNMSPWPSLRLPYWTLSKSSTLVTVYFWLIYDHNFFSSVVSTVVSSVDWTHWPLPPITKTCTHSLWPPLRLNSPSTAWVVVCILLPPQIPSTNHLHTTSVNIQY